MSDCRSSWLELLLRAEEHLVHSSQACTERDGVEGHRGRWAADLAVVAA
jgi:hypothetical protein